jgi:hypothetical protein
VVTETRGTSPDRETNRYDKPTIIFYEAGKKFGEEKDESNIEGAL